MKDPVLHVLVRLGDRVICLLPGLLHFLEQAILVLLGAFLRLMDVTAEPLLQLVGVPTVVRLHNVIVPVILHQVLEVLAVGRRRVGDVVV